MTENKSVIKVLANPISHAHPMMDERDVRERQIWVLQGKTNAKRRIEITGELKVLIDRIMSRKPEHKIRSTRLIVTEDGTPMSVAMLRGRFDLAREAVGVAKSEFQMRDLRAKAGTDKAESSDDILHARDQLGHTTVVMTEQYIRNRKGKKSRQLSELRTNSKIADQKQTRVCISSRPQTLDLRWCPKPESNRHALTSGGF